jgi:hypothetical protein
MTATLRRMAATIVSPAAPGCRWHARTYNERIVSNVFFSLGHAVTNHCDLEYKALEDFLFWYRARGHAASAWRSRFIRSGQPAHPTGWRGAASQARL